MHINNRQKIGHCFYDVLQGKCCAYAVLIQNISLEFISNNWDTAMTSHGNVTTALLKQANKRYIDGHFLSACITKSSEQTSLKLYTVNCATLKLLYDVAPNHNQKNSHRVLNKRFGVKECWSYIRRCLACKKLCPQLWDAHITSYVKFLICELSIQLWLIRQITPKNSKKKIKINIVW